MTKVRIAVAEFLRLLAPLLIGGIIGALFLLAMPHGM